MSYTIFKSKKTKEKNNEKVCYNAFTANDNKLLYFGRDVIRMNT